MSLNKKTARNMVIGIYYHPEAFPPTLNAVSELSDIFDHISIVHRPHLRGTWQYPANVTAHASGAHISASDQQVASLPRKIAFFLEFVWLFYKTCLREKPAVILVYDSFGLYAYHLVRSLLFFKHTAWYHNHDVTELEKLRKYSIGWFAGKAELKAFNYIDIFSLPANDRLGYFPMDRFKGKYFFIPNYPSRRFYSRFYKPKQLGHTVRLIFQGSIGPFHGIEEIIPLLGEKIDGYSLELVLKGPCRNEYREQYEEIARVNNVADKLTFIGITPYAEVPVTGATCHIGIGILAKQDVMNRTLGTASNKLYEYAALGLPVIYYNSDHFKKYLSKYDWALPTDLDPEKIKDCIRAMIHSYGELSGSAHRSFTEELNFELGFAEVKQYVSNGSL